MKPFKERRQYIRAGINIEVLCAVPNPSKWLDSFTAKAKNISRKGIFVQADDMISSGSDIYLQFYLYPQSTHFNIRGKVIWNRIDDVVKGMGIYFVNIGKKYEEMIEHYVLKHYDFKSPLK